MKALSITFIFFLFVTFSCTDHVSPSTELSIKTLPFELRVFKVQVDNLGAKAVTQYGIVYTVYPRGVGNHNLDPTINDNKIIFNTPIVLGVNRFNYAMDFLNGKTFFYYRAYAILEDGSVVYANRISFTI
jgi:hypothetical protein